MIDTNLEMTDKIGYLLLKKGIIDTKILEQALQIKQNDQDKLKRNLAQILVQEFSFDHDTIFREVAVLYAFKELNLHIEDLPEEKINEIKKSINVQPDDVKKLISEHSVIPIRLDKDKLTLAAIDPTDRALTKIAYALSAKKYEINYLRKKDYDKLIQIIMPRRNEYLQMIEESDEDRLSRKWKA